MFSNKYIVLLRNIFIFVANKKKLVLCLNLLTIHLTLVTTFGLKENKYSSLVQSQVVLDDLFV